MRGLIFAGVVIAYMLATVSCDRDPRRLENLRQWAGDYELQSFRA